MKYLITGAAGFIGMHVSEFLLRRGDFVIGLDNINDYYDPRLKEGRLKHLSRYEQFEFVKGDILDRDMLNKLFSHVDFDGVIHLAAQAGVRYSVTNPHTYADCNLTGFLNILECCRFNKIKHLVFASSSSVYGLNQKMPFSEIDSVDHPASLYAATKRANELMAHSYSHLYGIPITGLRFFTVYGPWGRPDQSLFLFVSAILSGRPIDIYNGGKMLRDFTYIDDVVSGVINVLDKPATTAEYFNFLSPAPNASTAPFRIFNIGNGGPVSLMDFIEAVEEILGVSAVKNFMPLQLGDVKETFADNSALYEWIEFIPKVGVRDGVQKFVDWYREFYI